MAPTSEETEEHQQPDHGPPRWLLTLWSGLGWGLATLLVAGFLWMQAGGSGGQGAVSSIDIVLWPQQVWPFGLVGGVIGGYVWQVFDRDGRRRGNRALLWGGWVLVLTPLALCCATLPFTNMQ